MEIRYSFPHFTFPFLFRLGSHICFSNFRKSLIHSLFSLLEPVFFPSCFVFSSSRATLSEQRSNLISSLFLQTGSITHKKFHFKRRQCPRREQHLSEPTFPGSPKAVLRLNLYRLWYVPGYCDLTRCQEQTSQVPRVFWTLNPHRAASRAGEENAPQERGRHTKPQRPTPVPPCISPHLAGSIVCSAW